MPKQSKRSTQLISALKKAWGYLREVTGDTAYENYAKYCGTKKSHSNPNGIAIMTRTEFYSESLKRKYSTINRCC
jgi:uncharacterized short protein YbdD (DUF466 family)